MKNPQKTAHKLQEALCRKGRPVNIEQRRFWSIRYERVMTKYIVRAKEPETGRNPKVFETYVITELVIFLAKMYGEAIERGD